MIDSKLSSCFFLRSGGFQWGLDTVTVLFPGGDRDARCFKRAEAEVAHAQDSPA